MPALARLTERNLLTIEPRLAEVVREAMRISPVPLAVTEGVRSAAMQAELYAVGAVRSLRSLHCEGKGVQLSAAIARRTRGDFPLMCLAASAMRRASITVGVPVVWCWCWGLLSDLPVVIDEAVRPSRWADPQGFVLAEARAGDKAALGA